MFSNRRKSGMSRRAAIRKATNKGRIGQRIQQPYGDTEREKKENVNNWSNQFLVKQALKEAQAWQRRVSAGLEL